jgi:glycerophosphoryl diester phosphodiesterase
MRAEPGPADTPAPRRAGPAISAHRGGSEIAPAGTYEAFLGALHVGADYLEFDVRRTCDGTLVACHRARFGWERGVAQLTHAALCELAGYEVPKIAELLRLIAGRAAAHADLKEGDSAAALARLALDLLEPGAIVVTTRDAAALRALKQAYPAVPTGLTMGGDLAQSTRFALGRARAPKLSRLDDAVAVGADWAVLHHRLVTARMLADCRSRGLKAMIWTVNRDRALARCLASPLIDVLVTDRPGHAVAERDRLAGN